MPFAMRCGRVAIVVLDSRSERDLWRTSYPILGAEQWQFIHTLLDNLDPGIEALAVVTPVPIVGMDPKGQAQLVFGNRTDDVELFKKGDAKGLLELQKSDKDDPGNLILAAAGGYVSRRFGVPTNFGSFNLNTIDDVRDQWAHRASRPEQIALLQRAGEGARTNRVASLPRKLVFLGGDLHSGGQFEISSRSPDYVAPCLISSGISRENDVSEPHIGTLVDQTFAVAPTIRASLQELINGYSFGVVHVVPTGGVAELTTYVVHQGTSIAKGAEIGLLIPGLTY